MERIIMRPLGTVPAVVCWHCSRTIDRELAVHAARYIYRGDQPSTAVIEDWLECECGAYQNLRRMSEIIVEPIRKDKAEQREEA
jgi:hypothetical protein